MTSAGSQAAAARVPIQIAYVVDDLECSAARWAATLGAGPFFVNRSRLGGPTFRDGHGRPAAYHHFNALGQWGSLMVELIEIETLTFDDPAMRDAMARRDGLHHIAWWRPDDVDESARLAERGWPVVATWELEADEWDVEEEGRSVRMGFNDARRDLGCLVEHYPRHEALVGLFERIAASAQGWDGREPVRGSYLD